MDEIWVKFNDIFKDVFDDDTIVINENTTADDIIGWDSLEHITLLTVIEEEFDIKFNIHDTRKLKNVGALVDETRRLIGEK